MDADAQPQPGTDEGALVDNAIAWLSEVLPPQWSVGRSQRVVTGERPQAVPHSADAAIDIRAPNGVYITFAVEAKPAFAPRDVEQLLTGFSRTLRSLAPNIPLLVVARWLSPRSQELLEKNGINFLDLSRNALLRLDNPAVYIRSSGASRDPQPRPRGQVRLRGAKASRVVRFLADVRPPYGVQQLAAATGVALGYVSRLLDALDAEALVDRSKRGRIESVDVPNLIRRWAETYDVFRTNDSMTFLASNGANSVFEHLGATSLANEIAVTGSFAAVRLAPVAAPALLVAYCRDAESVAAGLELLPATEGANVVLLRPYDAVVWQGVVEDRDLRFVAPSQAAVDSLTGNGRMPAEGEALLKWMADNESTWRLRGIDDALWQVER